MRIALVIFNADPQRGGAERYTADLAAALAARGHEVDLIAAQFSHTPPAGVRTVPIDAAAMTKSGRYRKFFQGVESHRDRTPYHIFHAMLPVPSCDIYHPHAGLAKAARAGLFNRKRKLLAEVEDQLLHGSDKPVILCLSDYVKGMFLGQYPDLADRMEKLFNAVDLSAFDPQKNSAAGQAVRKRFGFSPDQTVGLMMAQHFDRKGLPQAIEAVAQRVREKKTAPHLLVVGKDDPATSRRHARRLGVESRIVFAGTTNKPADFYAAADFFFLPTRHDSCSLVVLEALAMGLPVISTVYNGACEVMHSGREGFVLNDPGDVKALADAMGQMMDPKKRAAMRDACLALRTPLSYASHLDRLEEIYRRRSRQ